MIIAHSLILVSQMIKLVDWGGFAIIALIEVSDVLDQTEEVRDKITDYR